MSWRISGTYVACCSCNVMCPCPVDGPPTGPGGECFGLSLFSVADGNLDDLDLSGVDVGLVNHFPSNLTAGKWKLGLVVADGASDEQASALERIFKGDEGGAFADFAELTEEWLGMERGTVSLSNGNRPSASIGENSFTFEPLEGPPGSNTQTTVRNAAFGFAEEFRTGKAPGSMSAFGMDFDATYGETADYEFASEMEEGAPRGR